MPASSLMRCSARVGDGAMHALVGQLAQPVEHVALQDADHDSQITKAVPPAISDTVNGNTIAKMINTSRMVRRGRCIR